jgi:SpoVK/Ycf46/Vps4 family AAA+-type ATPase
VGPAVLHELERFPVHSLGLPSLLSDPSAKSPEEALVHIFGEARRNTPSILYLPQLHLWWDTVCVLCRGSRGVPMSVVVLRRSCYL